MPLPRTELCTFITTAISHEERELFLAHFKNENGQVEAQQMIAGGSAKTQFKPQEI